MAERNSLLTVEQDPQDDGTENNFAGTDIPDDNSEIDITNLPEKRIIDVSKKGTNAMKTIKEFLDKENISKTDINLLVIGRTGQGKSALVNSLIELGEDIAPESSDTDSCTTTSQYCIYPNVIPDVNVTIIDSPGLQDIQSKEHKHIQEMMNECHEISLVLYCMKMTDHRLTNDDEASLKKLHQMFGQKFWERVVFVLTFANTEMLKKWDRRDKDDKSKEPLNDDTDAWEKLKRERLTGRVQHRKEQLNVFVPELLQLQFQKETDFEALPAGYYDPKFDDNLRGINWQRDLIAFCCNTIKHKHRLSKLKLNKKIALAVIIDNHGEVKVENEERILNEEAAALKKAFEDLDFAVLYFNSLSLESIATLLEAISKADHSQLLMIALVFLSKGKTAELYDADGVVVPLDSDVFNPFQRCQIPVVFFFDVLVQNENDSTVDDTQKENDSTNDDILAINLPLDLCPPNSLLLATTHNSESSPVVKEFTQKLSHTCSIQECFKAICANNNSTTVKSIWCDTIGNNVFIVKSINESVDTLEEKLEVYHSIWYPIRCKTIDNLEEKKEEIMSIAHKERATIIGTSASGIALSSLAIAGIVLAPMTLGGSIAAFVVGGALSATAAGIGIGAKIMSSNFNNEKLKKAQEHINLDQQLSLMINEEADKYNQIMISAPSHVPESSVIGFQGATAISTGIGAGIAIGAEGAVETASLGLRTTGHVAGMALAGISLAVTIPIDIGMIAYNSYHLHKANNDPTGRTESNEAVKTLYNQIETLLKGMCHAINEVKHELQTEKNVLRDEKCGYEIEVPVKENEKHTVTVRTLFSGPFVYPEGYTLVSAVYDITMPKLPQPATIKLEHCVDESDQTRPDLSFAVGRVDLKNKKIIFEKVDQEFNGSIKQENSCLLCILYRRRLQDKTAVKYVAQYFYKRSYKNFWILNIVFTKHLKAHSKHAQSICTPDFEDPCPFAFNSEKLSLDLTCFKDTKEFSGWIVSPNNGENLPDRITRKEIDTAELREGSAKVLRKAFPSISLYVYIFNKAIAADEIKESFEIGGTNLSININRHKE